MTKEKKIYFPYLDVVRFVAAFMIVIYHAYKAWRGWFGELGILSNGEHKELSSFGTYIHHILDNLAIGVDVFFILSGFLITYILIKEKEKMGKINIFKFMVRRSLRIWPLYFLLIAIAPFLVSWVESTPPDYWYNILFINNFHTINTQEWTYPFAHFWSICIEEHFYLVWPFAIAFIPNKYLLRFFTAVILLSIGYRAYEAMTSEQYWYELYLHTFSRMDLLVLGAIGAYFYARKPFNIYLKSYLRYTIWAILLFTLSLESEVLWNGVLSAAFKKYLYISLITVLLLDYNFNPSFKHWLRPRSIFHYFGRISYGIYMYGNILILIIMKRIMMDYNITNLYMYMLIVTVLSLGVPIISYELFEKPILKFKKHFEIIKTQR